MNLLSVIGLYFLSRVTAVLYRLGGSSKEDQEKEYGWIPKWMRNIPKKRDAFSNITILLGAFLMGVQGDFWLGWVLAFGLMWASLSSYWDWLFKYDNFWFHGFMCGLSFMPLVIWGNVSWTALVVRSLLSGLLVGWWSITNGDAYKEEKGRGFILNILNLVFGIVR